MKKFILLILLLGCRIDFYHDAANPCTTDATEECERWKIKYPKDYYKYQQRLKKDSCYRTSPKTR